MSPEPRELVGRSVGSYILDRLLGQGGFAWVFAAHRAADARPAAIKILKPRYAGDSDFETRFRHEATVAADLKHPNIVPIHEIGADRGLTFFAMDFYGDSLATLIQRDGPLAEERLLAVAMDITQALEFAHGAGVVHRDLKADNVLIGPDGDAVLSDFGIARTASGYVTAAGTDMTIGTPAYVSPELAQGRPFDGRSDLYALGVTLYKAATGELPFRSTDWFKLARMHVEDAPAPPTSRRPGFSPRLEQVILRCLAKHPDDRYPSATRLLADLRAIAAERNPGSLVPQARTGFSGKGVGRRRWLRRVGAVALVVAAAVFVVWLTTR